MPQVELVFLALLVIQAVQDELARTVVWAIQEKMVTLVIQDDQVLEATQANQVSPVFQDLKVHPALEANTVPSVSSLPDTRNPPLFQLAHEVPPSSGLVTLCSTPLETCSTKPKVLDPLVLVSASSPPCHTPTVRTVVCASTLAGTASLTG